MIEYVFIVINNNKYNYEYNSPSFVNLNEKIERCSKIKHWPNLTDILLSES